MFHTTLVQYHCLLIVRFNMALVVNAIIFLCFFFFLSYFHIFLIVDVKGYCYTWSHSDTLTYTWKDSLEEGSASYLYNTQHSQQTDIHDPSGIWTSTPSKWVTADYQNNYKYNFSCCFVWVRYLVSHTEGRIQAESDYASHKSRPSSVPRGIVDSYSILPWVTWEAVTFVEGIPWWRLPRHMLANGALV